MIYNSEVAVELTSIECCSCNALFAVTAITERKLRRSHDWFWCPVCGAHQHFPGESDIEKQQRLRRRAEENEERAKAQRQHYKDEADTAERRRRAEKGAKTKLQKRVANGICPCCNRHFDNVQQHVKTKHPKFLEKTK